MCNIRQPLSCTVQQIRWKLMKGSCGWTSLNKQTIVYLFRGKTVSWKVLPWLVWRFKQIWVYLWQVGGENGETFQYIPAKLDAVHIFSYQNNVTYSSICVVISFRYCSVSTDYVMTAFSSQNWTCEAAAKSALPVGIETIQQTSQ